MSIIPCRQLLTSSLTLYVSWWGQDTNDGLAPSTAFQTIQAAILAFSTKYDTGGYNHFISLADGYYNGATLTEVTGGGSITITGQGATTFLKGNIQVNQRRTKYILKNLTFVPENTFAVSALNGYIELAEGITYNITQATNPALLVSELDGVIRVTNDFALTYTTGVLPTLGFTRSKGQIRLKDIQVTATGALNWLTACLWSQSGGLIDARNFRHTGSDPTTGLRWIQESGGTIIGDSGTDILGDTDGSVALVTQTEPIVIPQAQLGFNLPISFSTATYTLS
jgi:pectin methylesterase-like acyl-CoA thioesterase